MPYRDIEEGRRKSRERFRRRVEQRRAAGLCPRCGVRPPAPGRSVCGNCLEQSNRASRTRDARLRAEGKPRRDPARAKEYGQEWNRRERAERAGRGSCTRCGKRPAVPGRKSCEPCLEKGRRADHARYAAGKAAGLKYGGADPEVKRCAGRAKGRRRQKARIEAGTCIRCGKRPPVERGTTCRPCRDRRQAAEKRRYAERKAARLCTRCAGPVSDGLTLCAPCGTVDRACQDPERKNRRSRKLYAIRRAAGNCTACGAPSQGAARCGPCAERSYHGSAQFKGIPVWEPTYMVIELATGREHGPFDDPADVALCLAFEKLARDEVEVVRDASPLATLAGWE